MFFMILVAASLIGALLHLVLDTQHPRGGRRAVELLLVYFTVIFLGFGQFVIALGHLTRPEQWALYLGWPPGNPFQIEMGFASMGLATLGILAIWLRGNYIVAPVLGSSIFLVGSAGVHTFAVRYTASQQAAISRSVLFTDIMVPGLILFLLLIYVIMLREPPKPVPVREDDGMLPEEEPR